MQIGTKAIEFDKYNFNSVRITIQVREGVQMEKTFLNGHCPYRSYPPPPGRGNGQRGPFFRPSKTTFSAYYRIKF